MEHRREKRKNTERRQKQQQHDFRAFKNQKTIFEGQTLSILEFSVWNPQARIDLVKLQMNSCNTLMFSLVKPKTHFWLASGRRPLIMQEWPWTEVADSLSKVGIRMGGSSAGRGHGRSRVAVCNVPALQEKQAQDEHRSKLQEQNFRRKNCQRSNAT